MLRFDCKRQLFPPKILQSTQIPLPLNVIINYRMKSNNRFFLGLLLLLSHFSAFAQQYVVKGGSHEPMLAINEISYKLKVYVLDGTENTSISYTSSSTNHQWKRYKTKYLEAENVNSQQQGTTSVITDLEDGYGYFVDEGTFSTTYIWLIDYNKHPFIINDLLVSENSDPCTGIFLKGDQPIDNLSYHTPDGSIKTIKRKFEISYNTLEWNDSSHSFQNILKTKKIEGNPYSQLIDSIYTDTDITLSGDQFASYFGKAQSATINNYITSQLLLRTDTTALVDESDNMSAKSDGLSAPATIRFTAYANEPTATLYVWKIYREEDGPDNPIVRFTEPETEYTFNEYGKFVAEVEVSGNNNCYVTSDPISLDISESFLDVPNAFSPGTTPGVNDEFKVVYKSLVRFSCWIFNRWGQELYHWTNPALGWDGKKGGKYVAPGVCFSVLEAEGSDGKKYKKKGDINILRPKNEDTSSSGKENSSL